MRTEDMKVLIDGYLSGAYIPPAVFEYVLMEVSKRLEREMRASADRPDPYLAANDKERSRTHIRIVRKPNH